MSRLLLSTILLLLIIGSCKKDIKGDSPGEPGGGDTTTTSKTQVQVQVPAGSSYDPVGSSVLASFQYTEVDANNYTPANVDTGGVTMAYVFNKEDKLMMAGFVTDSSRLISPATTAKVLLHWGLKFPFQPGYVTDVYINNIDKIEAAREWVTKFETLFKADPFVVSNGSFKNDLKTAIEKIRNRQTLDIKGKNASDVQVDDNDIKSGLQVFEDGLSKVSINNTFRRRGHAFLYKMKYIDDNGHAQTVLQKISETSTAQKDLAVDPRSGITSVMGEIGKFIETYNTENSTQSFVVKSGPFDLALEDKEAEVTYKLRVVGPGLRGKLLTRDEDDKLTILEAETFYFDMVIPAIGTITSVAGMSKRPEVDATMRERVVETVKGWWKTLPDVYEEVKKGKYQGAVKKFLEAMYKDAGGNFLNEACTLIGDIYKADPKTLLGGGVAKLNKIMTAFDATLGTSDVFAVGLDCLASNAVEEWEVKARTSKVSLTPDEQATVVASQKEITATIKNLDVAPDTHPNFEWSTSGKYGYLKDTKGHSGASFESTDEKIFYNCNATASSLSDGDNWEYIYVKAYYAGELIGTDTAKINVRKLKYKMMPNNITLTGKKGTNNNEVRLYLVRQDNVIDIPNNLLDYKIVWSTAGKYGKLLGKETDPSTTVTVYDDNSAWYDCTDDKTKEASETVTARIYVKAKDDADYHLLDEVTGTVKIDNDEKKKIITVGLTYLNGCWQEGNCYTYPVAVFPYEDSAKKYKVMFYNFTGTATANVPEGQTYSWNKGAAPPVYYSTFPETKDISGGSYYISLGRTWCAGPPAGCNSGSSAEWEAKYIQGWGTAVKAEVTYYY